jgi:alpha-amylase
VAKYYKDSLGFDGWRFDFVKGYSPLVVKDWLAEVGGISIGEYFDGNVTLVNNWCFSSNSGAFDFPLYFSMDAAFDGNNMLSLDGAGLIAVNPSRAYTFAANHDIDDISSANKMKAYAFITAAEGTPFIFYKDYENGDKAKMNALIAIHKTLAAGTTTKLFSSNTEFIFRRNGTPGLVAYFNNGEPSSRRIQTHWAKTVLKDYANDNSDVTTDAGGFVTIPCKANSYCVYAPK